MRWMTARHLHHHQDRRLRHICGQVTYKLISRMARLRRPRLRGLRRPQLQHQHCRQPRRHQHHCRFSCRHHRSIIPFSPARLKMETHVPSAYRFSFVRLVNYYYDIYCEPTGARINFNAMKVKIYLFGFVYKLVYRPFTMGDISFFLRMTGTNFQHEIY